MFGGQQPRCSAVVQWRRQWTECRSFNCCSGRHRERRRATVLDLHQQQSSRTFSQRCITGLGRRWRSVGDRERRHVDTAAESASSRGGRWRNCRYRGIDAVAARPRHAAAATARSCTDSRRQQLQLRRQQSLLQTAPISFAVAVVVVDVRCCSILSSAFRDSAARTPGPLQRRGCRSTATSATAVGGGRETGRTASCRS